MNLNCFKNLMYGAQYKGQESGYHRIIIQCRGWFVCFHHPPAHVGFGLMAALCTGLLHYLVSSLEFCFLGRKSIHLAGPPRNSIITRWDVQELDLETPTMSPLLFVFCYLCNFCFHENVLLFIVHFELFCMTSLCLCLPNWPAVTTGKHFQKKMASVVQYRC